MSTGRQPAVPFSALLRQLRLAAGLTQEELAERADLSERAVRRLERDHDRTPRLHTVRLLGRALDLSAQEQSHLLDAARPADPGVEALEGVAPLPHAPTPLLGREADVTVVKIQLEDSRLVTVSGMGGVGKTRLALALAEELQTSFERVVFVELAPLRDPDHVIEAIASSLTIRGEGTTPLFTLVANQLRSEHDLLVLDNMEHLMPARDIVLELLETCPELRVLITSREMLRVRGERVYTLGPLELPEREVDIELSPAVRLFLDRARAAGGTIAPDQATARAVAQICRRLDGLPLAIELAAAWVPVLSPHALLARLTSRLPHLDRGPHDLPVRQRTMRDTLTWSYDLLTAGEQVFFRRLAVFAGGCTLVAAEAVCRRDDQSQLDVLAGLASLVDKSLLTAHEGTGSEQDPRFGMLETVREFADEQLSESPESATIHGRHAAYFVTLADQAEPALSGPGQSGWLDRLEREHDNLRAALNWARQTDDIGLGLQLSGRLWPFWQARNHYDEAQRWLDAFLPHAESAGVSPSIQARALYAAGALASVRVDKELPFALLRKARVLARQAGDDACGAATLRLLAATEQAQSNYQQAGELLDEALVVCQQMDDQAGVCAILSALATAARYQGDFAQATSLYGEALTIGRAIGDDRRVADTFARLGSLETERGRPSRSRPLFDLALALHRELDDAFGMADILLRSGEAAADMGAFADAMAHYEECLPIFQRLGASYAVAYVHLFQAESALGTGDLASAEELATESLAFFREISDRRSTAEAIFQLADAARQRQHFDEALTLYKESLTLHQALNTRPHIALCLERMAVLGHHQESGDRAVRLHGAAMALRKQMDSEMAPADRDEYRVCMAAVRDRMGDEAFTTRETEGLAMSLKQAMAYALEEIPVGVTQRHDHDRVDQPA